MLEKNPKTRISAKEALGHAWFTQELTDCTTLSTAQINMRKYNGDKFFNVEKIKPEFVTVTCTPLFTSKFAACKDSPLIFSRFICKSPGGTTVHKRARGEDAKSEVLFSLFL